MTSHGSGQGSERHGNGGPGHEARDIDVTRVVIAGTILLLVCALSLVAMNWTFNYFAVREAKTQPRPSTLTPTAGREEPPEPKLQTASSDDLRTLRAAEETELTSYGWIDKKAGVVRIPVERAIDLVAARGLPLRPAEGKPAHESELGKHAPQPSAARAEPGGAARAEPGRTAASRQRRTSREGAQSQ